MSTKQSRIFSLIKGMLAVGLVYVLVASPIVAQANDKNQDLVRAAKEGRLEEVTRPLNSGADVNAKDNEGRTVLKAATQAGRQKIVELLKAHGAKE